jgi:hypothetical protein
MINSKQLALFAGAINTRERFPRHTAKTSGVGFLGRPFAFFSLAQFG